MDRLTNPYTPNAGAAPTVMIGREDQTEAFEVLLGRLAAGRTEQSMIVTGLRGVGKTVLLNRFASLAEHAGWRTIEIEVSSRGDDAAFRRQVYIGARRALLTISRPDRWRQRLRTAFSVLTSFSAKADPTGNVSIEFGIEPAIGRADTGDLAVDMTDLLVSLGEAAADEGIGVVFLIDEIQFLSAPQMESLIMAIHKTVQRALPVTVAGAGLPLIAKLTGNAKSYSERLFKFPVIDHLTRAQAHDALRIPAQRAGASFDTDALDEAFHITDGYPYFIQEIGSAAWALSPGPGITLDDVRRAHVDYTAKLDSSFFRLRLDRATAMERAYMRAMAELGPGSHPAKNVAQLLGRTTMQTGSTRTSLTNKGLITAAADYGSSRFTVPHFDRFMLRAIPDLEVPPIRARR